MNSGVKKKKPCRFKWFEEARYGLFIHWGLYSLLGRGEQVLFRERLNQIRYAQLSDRFNPRHFNAEAWIEQAKSAGMKYAVLTAKHHDGFCLFDSAVSDFTTTKTRCGRDIVGEFVSACRKHRMRVGLYYSLADWRKAAYFRGPQKSPKCFEQFIQYMHTQVEELCRNYGPIDVLWFDGGWPWTSHDWRTESLDRLIRRYQPNVIINDRLHGGGAGNVVPAGTWSQKTQGYFTTAEQCIGGNGSSWPVETERTTQSVWWGFVKNDPFWKTPAEVLRLLVEAAANGSNLLLNVGPDADGRFPKPFARILNQTGEWLRVNGESIYNTRAELADCSTFGKMTVKNNAVYLHVFYWPGTELCLYGLANRVVSARILTDGGDGLNRIKIVQEGDHLYLRNLPEHPVHPVCTVIRLGVKGQPRERKSLIRLWDDHTTIEPLAKWVEQS